MWTIIITAVVLFLFGALWFTFLFGKVWARLMNFSPESQARANEKGMVTPMVINFILNVVTAWVVVYLFPQVLATSLTEFLKVIFVIYIGFTLPQYVNQALWESKSWKLVLLNTVYGFLYFAIAASVVYYMQ